MLKRAALEVLGAAAFFPVASLAPLKPPDLLLNINSNPSTTCSRCPPRVTLFRGLATADAVGTSWPKGWAARWTPSPARRSVHNGDTSQLRSSRSFELKNTSERPWCNNVPGCTGVADNRWGSLKAYPTSPVQIWFGNLSYTLLEFHFHTPAEHLVNGKLTEMEVHFVFEKDRGQACSSGGLLVIGQRITKGQRNPELDKIFGPNVTLPTSYATSGPPFTTVEVRISKVLSGLEDSYRYAGSLTAPFYIATCENPPGNPNNQLDCTALPGF